MALPNVDKFYNDLGDLIKSERIKKNVTQDYLADELGLTRASVINLEKGRHRPSIYQLLVIAQCLKVDYVQLIPAILNSATNEPKLPPSDLGTVISDQEEIDNTSKDFILRFLSTTVKS
jgi:transcriptional regulator with XRE-family HTH domain